jgi:hypothetical protein
LTIEVSTHELLQFDHIVVKCVLRNDSIVSITIDDWLGLFPDFVRIEMREKQKWKPLRSMFSQVGTWELGPAPDPILEAGAEYAQYSSIFLEGQDFVFSKPGTFEIRAVARCSGNEIVSNAIKLVVARRDPRILARIRDAVTDTPVSFSPGMSLEEKRSAVINSRRRGKFVGLGAITFAGFEGNTSQNINAIADVGGNLGKGIGRLQLLSRILNGQEPTGEDVIGYVRQELDNQVDAEVALHVLGQHYKRHKDWLNLAQVVDALPDRTIQMYEWEKEIARRLQTVPRVVVPEFEDRR